MVTPHQSETSFGPLARIWLILLAAMIVQPLAGATQGRTQNPQAATRIELLYNNVVVTLKSGQIQYGLFLGVEGDALVVKAGSEERHIPRTEISRISLERPSRRGSYITTGALLGLYSGLMTSEENGYLPAHINAFSLLFYESLYLAAGGGLGYLSSLIAGSEARFSFQEPGERANREWERLRRYAAGVPSARRVHVSVQGGYVFFGPRATYQDIYRRNLKDFGLSGPYYEGQNVSVLRQVRLTVSVFRWLEAGLAGVRISEPSYSVGKSDYSYSGAWPNFTYQSSSQYLDAHFSSTGYFAVFGARLPQDRQSPVSFTAGFGLGAQKIDFGFLATHEATKNSIVLIDVREDHSVLKTALSALIYGEASVVIKGGLALGLTGDIVFGPSEEVPPSSALGIAAHKVRFGNSSVGLSLGYHF